MKTKIDRIAKALADMHLITQHQTGDMVPQSLRSYLELVVEEDVTGDVTVDGILQEMARVAIRAYERDV